MSSWQLEQAYWKLRCSITCKEAGTNSCLQRDAVGDLDVDGSDFLVWQRELGTGTTAASTNAPVPESATLMLLFWRRLVGVSGDAGPHRKYRQLINA